MAWSEDMGAFFGADAPGAALVQWTPADGSPAQETYGFLDTPDQLMLGTAVIGADLQLAYAHGALDGLAEGEQITVGGTIYRVRETPRRVGDGREMRVGLSGAF